MLKSGWRIRVFGIVQGVGFRPFVYRLANRLGLCGYVQNRGFGVEIYLEGEKIEEFKDRLLEEKPIFSKITGIEIRRTKIKNCQGFEILQAEKEESFVFTPPDIFTCNECQKELFLKENRRFKYPFITCTHCGPRYSIIKRLPYEREGTTMSIFNMCLGCEREYKDPQDRRFHAEPIGCWECGPRLSGTIENGIKAIKQGKIVGLKGIGGFHLIVDARNKDAILRLRKIKKRERKPFALMAKDLNVVSRIAIFNDTEKALLVSPQRPIVLLKKKEDLFGISPYLDTYGIMLPYTPLHHLLMEKGNLVVATSANEAESPIFKKEEEGVRNLCDLVITHNREIAIRCDDSVIKVVNEEPLFIRRARGYVPEPLRVKNVKKEIIALGGELKNTISIYKDGFIITSQYLGDLKDYRNFRYFEEVLEHYKNLYSLKPKIVISDMHPDFLSTECALKMGIRHIKVQHHFAHILGCMIENEIKQGEKVLGVSFDGMGFGADETIWGGEFLICNYKGFKRFANFKPIPLPGQDLAVKEPWRMAVSYLFDVFGRNFPFILDIPPDSYYLVISQIEKKINTVLTSSAGRLFDAVSAMLGISPSSIEFEGEAAMRLEAIAEDLEEEDKNSYEMYFLKDKGRYVIDFSPMIKGIIKDLKKGENKGIISGKFHNTLAMVILGISIFAKERFKINKVALSGGCFLNSLLLKKTEKLLKDSKFIVLRNKKFSPNDEGLSLGQIAHGIFVT